MTDTKTLYTEATQHCDFNHSVELKEVYKRTLDADLIKAAAAVASNHVDKFRPSAEVAQLPYHSSVIMSGASEPQKNFCKSLGIQAVGTVALPVLPDLKKLAEAGFIGLDPTASEEDRIKIYGSFLHVLVFSSVAIGNVCQQNLNVSKMLGAINEFAKSKTGYKYSSTGRAIAATLQMSFKLSTDESLKKFGIILLASAYGLLLTIITQKADVRSQWYSSFEKVGLAFISVTSRNAIPDIVAKAQAMSNDNVAMICCNVPQAEITKMLKAKYGSPDFLSSPLGLIDIDIFDKVRAWSSFTNLLGASPELARSNQSEKYAAYKAAKENYEAQAASRQVTGRVRRGR